MENKVLSISIPTFSRPEILRENILLMLPEIREFSVPIYISDDSLDILTENMIALCASRTWLFIERTILLRW